MLVEAPFAVPVSDRSAPEMLTMIAIPKIKA